MVLKKATPLRVTIALSAFFLLGCNGKSLEKKSKHQPELQVQMLQARDISIPNHYLCAINAVEYVEIRARVQGYLEEIYVDEGQLVKKGQPLFRISSNEYREMVSKAEANLQRSIAEAKATNLEVDRVALMVEKDVISPTELEVAKAKRDAALSGIEEAKSILQNAKTNLNYTFVRAPFNGLVDRIPFKIGSLINSGTLLTSVSNTSEVFAYFRVSETDYLRFLQHDLNTTSLMNKERKVALILADGTTYKHTGYIETMEGDFDRETGSIAFRARFPNPEMLLKHGSSGSIVMQKELENALLVPQQSTFTIQDKNYVFIVDRDTARARSFSVIAQYGDYFVADGLKKGDRIIIEGLQQIRDGVPIKPKLLPADSTLVSKL